MNYEKKYRDLVEAVKELQEANPSDEGIQKLVEDNVPELKESEDERIRKHLIGVVELYYGNTDEQEKKDCLAWLEKKCEQKIADGTFVNVDDVRENFVKEVYRVLANDTTNDRANDIIYYFDSLPTIYLHTNKSLPSDSDDFDMNYILKTQTWSEEDRKMSRFIGNAITADDASIYLKSKGIQVIDAHAWLEELKDKVQPQPKWSEEDEKMRAAIIFTLAGFMGNEDKIDWLKSLRPQLQWKPTKRQVLELSCAISGFSFNKPILVELEEDLKKLREE